MTNNVRAARFLFCANAGITESLTNEMHSAERQK
jgi:hypothetical protein